MYRMSRKRRPLQRWRLPPGAWLSDLRPEPPYRSVEAEFLSLLDQFVEGLVARYVVTALVGHKVAISDTAMDADRLRWQIAVFEEAHQEWSRHVQDVGRLLRGQLGRSQGRLTRRCRRAISPNTSISSPHGGR